MMKMATALLPSQGWTTCGHSTQIFLSRCYSEPSCVTPEEEWRDAESLQQELDARRARMAAGHADVLGELDADEDDGDGDFSR